MQTNAVEQLRFEYESHLFQGLIRESEVQAWQQENTRQNYFNLRKRHLLGTAVKITSTLFPELDGIYQDCLHRIGGQLTGHLYVHQSSEYNANIYSHNQRFDVLLTSALVKDFSSSEIAFVIGHELGHALFEHSNIPAGVLLFDKDAPAISNELAKRLFQWSRAAEISADRVGFLTCGSLSTAANAFFKTASGIHFSDDNRIVQALRAQFEEIKALTAEMDSVGLSTHPLIPIRFKSLELISLDLLSFRNTGKPLNQRDLQMINSQVQEVLIQTDPVKLEAFANDSPPPTVSTQENLALMALCLLYVAISDKRLTLNEEKFIRDLIQQAQGNLQIDSILADYRANPVIFQKALREEIGHCHCDISQDQMITVLHHCLLMCQYPVNHKEIEAMRILCKTLNKDEGLLDSLLSTH